MKGIKRKGKRKREGELHFFFWERGGGVFFLLIIRVDRYFLIRERKGRNFLDFRKSQLILKHTSRKYQKKMNINTNLDEDNDISDENIATQPPISINHLKQFRLL